MLYHTRKKTAFVSYALCPVLEKHFGRSAAYILQQLHYWLLLENTSLGIIHENRQWFYNSHEQWVDCFKKQNIYLSASSIRRGLDLLQSKDVIRVCCFPKPGNNINSYTIDYQRLETAVGEIPQTRLHTIPHITALPSHSSAVINPNGDELKDCVKLLGEHAAPLSKPVHVDMNKPVQSAHLNTLKPVKPAQMNRPINRYITTNHLTKNLSSELRGGPIPMSVQQQQPIQHERKNSKVSSEMIRIWNETIEYESTPVLLTEQRSCYLMAAFKQFFNSDLEQWIAFCCKIASSKFLMGESPASNWRIDLDWALHFNKLRLICDGKRYTFGDRVVLDQTKKQLYNLERKPHVSSYPLKQQERSDALEIRTHIQKALNTHYDDHQGGLYKSWFEDTHIDVEEHEKHVKKICLYVKLPFIKEQITIRFRDLCETLFDKICVGMPEIKSLDKERLNLQEDSTAFGESR